MLSSAPQRALFALLVALPLSACESDAAPEAAQPDAAGPDASSEVTPGPGEDPMLEGMMVYTTPLSQASSFTCNTCHALEEPAEDGVRRVGHAIGDATRRSSWKNGQLDDVRLAANSCLVEWMNAEPWEADDPQWLALYDFLDDHATEDSAPDVTIQIVEPPADPTGGDPEAGRTLFNASCVMCHGTDGGGTLRGPPIAGRGLEPTYIAQRVRTSGRADSDVYEGLAGGIMPFWGADRLSDDELRNLAAFVASSDPAPEPQPNPDPGPDPGPEPSDCDATHPRVGWTTELSMLFHDVAGTATIVDDCTIVVEDFFFDGNGIDVQMYAATDGNYTQGFSISGQLYNFPTGYHGDTLTLTLPEGPTLDEVDGISVWCVAVGVSFGDGLFAAP